MYTGSKMDHNDRDDKILPFSSTKNWIMAYLERKDNVSYSLVRSVINASVACFVVALEKEEGYSDWYFHPIIASLYLLMGRNCPSVTALRLALIITTSNTSGKAIQFSSFWHMQQRPIFIVILLKPEVRALRGKWQEETGRCFKDWWGLGSPRLDLLGHGYLHYTGTGWNGGHALQYYIHFI